MKKFIAGLWCYLAMSFTLAGIIGAICEITKAQGFVAIGYFLLLLVCLAFFVILAYFIGDRMDRKEDKNADR